MKKKVAIIGHGFLGKWHLQKAVGLVGLEKVIVVDPSVESLKAARDNYPGLQTCTDLKECIDEIEAGIIVTPTSFHFNFAKYLIENGKHVFCEKPVTSTYSESLELKELLSNKGLIFQVGHSERFHQVWDKKGEWSNYFSEKSDVKIYRGAPFKGRATDVDVVQDLMIHDIDLMLYLFNEKPVSVYSVGAKIRTDKWDYVNSIFEFVSGQVVSISVGRNQVEEKREIEITNKYGSLKVDLMRNEWIEAKSEGLDILRGSYEKRDHLLLEQEHFYNSINNNESAIISIDDGVDALRVMDAVSRGLDSGKRISIYE